LNELKTIKDHFIKNHTILIDDVRLFADGRHPAMPISIAQVKDFILLLIRIISLLMKTDSLTMIFWLPMLNAKVESAFSASQEQQGQTIGKYGKPDNEYQQKAQTPGRQHAGKNGDPRRPDWYYRSH